MGWERSMSTSSAICCSMVHHLSLGKLFILQTLVQESTMTNPKVLSKLLSFSDGKQWIGRGCGVYMQQATKQTSCYIYI